MKKYLKRTACLVGLLVPIMALANYKKDYCDNNDYLGNSGSKYPHLHCGKDFFTFSRTSSNHKNLHDGQGKDGAGCKRAKEVLDDPPDATNTANPQAITTAIRAFYDAECQ